jgi:peptidylprolyl isomerase
MGRLIPGFDYGVTGMRVGGKRRLFIPWQIAYGTRSIPDRPDHPGIPAKSDLIFDVELVEVSDMPAPQPRPMAPPAGAPGGASGQPATPPPTGSTPPSGQPASPDSSKPNTPPDTKPAQPSTPPQHQ